MDMSTQEIYHSVFKEYPDVFDTEKLSKALGVSPKVVYRLLKNDIIKSSKVGRAYRIPKINVMKYIKIFDSSICE